jgi:type II secretory pathway predicted ATPase ExeA
MDEAHLLTLDQSEELRLLTERRYVDTLWQYVWLERVV